MGGPLLGRRVFRLRNVASFLLALVVLYLVYRELLGLDGHHRSATVTVYLCIQPEGIA